MWSVCGYVGMYTILISVLLFYISCILLDGVYIAIYSILLAD